jgi:ElaB/YqjD/DUF883 family membrane-anchored ribosome-binding protein
MNTTTEIRNNKSKLQETFEAAGKVAEIGIDVTALKKKVEHAVEDAVEDAQRLAKQGQHKLEDVVDDTTYLIKKNPWQSVGYVFGAGLGIGFVTGFLLTRRGNGENVH